MRIKNKRAFERLIRRWDGEDGGTASATAIGTESSSATAGTETTPQTQNTTAQAQETQPFKTFASESEYQKEVDFRVQQALKTHEEKLKGKLTPEIRKQLEAEANMTAEQKYQVQLDALEADKKALLKEKSRIKAEALFASKGIGEAERAAMLDSIVTEDAEQSVKNAQALIDAIEAAANEKIKAAMKDVKAPSSTAAAQTADSPDVAYAKKLADRRSASAKASNETLNYYLGGNKK